jgi:glycosyltransferase involved in cell wall biosynthesis
MTTICKASPDMSTPSQNEALATSTPVIATRQGAIPEQIHDGYNGFLRQAEPTAIADAIEHLWRNPTLYGELSRNARSHFLAHYTSEKHLERLIPLIVGTDNQRAM